MKNKTKGERIFRGDTVFRVINENAECSETPDEDGRVQVMFCDGLAIVPEDWLYLAGELWHNRFFN